MTEDAIINLLKQYLLAPHIATVISMPDSGLDTMIDLQQHGDLARMYTLFNLVPSGMAVLRKALKESIAERGRLVNEAEGGVTGAAGDETEAGPSALGSSRAPADTDMGSPDAPIPTPSSKPSKGKGKERANGTASGAAASAAPPPQGKKTLDAALKWVQDVLDLKDLFDRLLKVCFADDRIIQAAMNEVRRRTLIFRVLHTLTRKITGVLMQAFESFINLHPKAPEYISLFIDENLKKGLKGVRISSETP